MWLDQSLGEVSTSGLNSLQSARPYSHVIRLLMPLSIDKGEQLPSHFRWHWVACHDSCGTAEELCFLNTLPYLNLCPDLVPHLLWRRPFRASLVSSGPSLIQRYCPHLGIEFFSGTQNEPNSWPSLICRTKGEQWPYIFLLLVILRVEEEWELICPSSRESGTVADHFPSVNRDKKSRPDMELGRKRRENKVISSVHACPKHSCVWLWRKQGEINGSQRGGGECWDKVRAGEKETCSPKRQRNDIEAGKEVGPEREALSGLNLSGVSTVSPIQAWGWVEYVEISNPRALHACTVFSLCPWAWDNNNQERDSKEEKRGWWWWRRYETLINAQCS